MIRLSHTRLTESGSQRGSCLGDLQNILQNCPDMMPFGQFTKRSIIGAALPTLSSLKRVREMLIFQSSLSLMNMEMEIPLMDLVELLLMLTIQKQETFTLMTLKTGPLMSIGVLIFCRH